MSHTVLRADAAPALSSTISPSWSLLEVQTSDSKPLLTIGTDGTVTLSPDINIDQLRGLPLYALLTISAMVNKAICEHQDYAGSIPDSDRLARAVLSGDASAAYPLADDILAERAQPDGFASREDLLGRIEVLEEEVSWKTDQIECLEIEARGYIHGK